MTTLISSADWRAVHGGLILLLLPLPTLVFGTVYWPWHLLLPLLVYGTLVGLVPPLRRSVLYCSWGRTDRSALALTAVILLGSCAALFLFQHLGRPDLAYLRASFPDNRGWLLELIVAGVVFAVVNALMEELIFRGILLDALDARLGPTVALLVQAAVFGYAHWEGYPPGPVGMVLAGIYGLVLGGLRLWTGGLAAPVFAHIGADVAIFVIVMRDG